MDCINILNDIFSEKSNIKESTLKKVEELLNFKRKNIIKSPYESIIKEAMDIFKKTIKNSIEKDVFKKIFMDSIRRRCKKTIDSYGILHSRYIINMKISEAFKNNSSSLEIKENQLYPLPIYACMLKTVKKLTLSEN